MTVAAVDKELYGESVDVIRENAKNGEIQVELFNGEIGLEDLFKHMKRINLTGILRALDGLEFESEIE